MHSINTPESGLTSMDERMAGLMEGEGVEKKSLQNDFPYFCPF